MATPKKKPAPKKAAKKADKTVKEMSPQVAARVAAMAKGNTEAPAAPKKDSAPKERKTRKLRGQTEIATYANFDQLNGKTLAPDNTVIFKRDGKEITFNVTANGLDPHSKEKGAPALFKQLNINADIAARKCYSYDRADAGGSGFPCAKVGDMASVTRLVLVLFLFNEGAEAVDLKMYNRHWKHITPAMLSNDAPATDEAEA